MKRRLLLCLTALAISTGCGSQNTASGTTTTSTAAPPTTAATTVTTPTTSAGVTEASVPPTSPTRYLTGVTASHIDGHDQLSFTFNDGVPGYTAEYVKPPLLNDGEGAPVAISGDSIIKIVFAYANTVDLSNNSKVYYAGSKRISPANTTVVSEVAFVSEFEGRLLWGVGTKTKTNFTVATNGNTLTFTFN